MRRFGLMLDLSKPLIVSRFYTLSAMPEVASLLKEEVCQVVTASEGEFTNAAMQNMMKLDSYMKEVTRMYPLLAGSFQRKVLKAFTLSNGQTIPAGVIVEIAQGGVGLDESIHPDPTTFDPLRFHKIRTSKEEERTSTEADLASNSQFVSVGSTSLTFGYGRHACPGRFLACNEIKMILATALMHYEIKNVDGEKERYRNIQIGQQVRTISNIRDSGARY